MRTLLRGRGIMEEVLYHKSVTAFSIYVSSYCFLTLIGLRMGKGHCVPLYLSNFQE